MSTNAHRERLMQVLLGPHVSEKATGLAEAGNQVVFKVRGDATKADIRQAVELLVRGQGRARVRRADSGEAEALRPARRCTRRRGRRPTCGSHRVKTSISWAPSN